MKENVDKHIEAIADKLMQEAPVESPSMDFTSKVMMGIEEIARSKSTVYKPLITKPVWMLVAATIVGILVYSYFGTSTDSEVLKSVDLSVLSNNKLTNALTAVSFSKTILYAATLFALMFAIQVPLLKGYFDRRLRL